MSEAYIVEYGDERGNQRQTTYTEGVCLIPASKAVEDVLSTLEALGVSRHDPFVPERPVYCGTVENNLHNYVMAAIPWASLWDIGEGDNPFTVHGYDTERGNWSVSLIIVSGV